jgi:hypothetical protein
MVCVGIRVNPTATARERDRRCHSICDAVDHCEGARARSVNLVESGIDPDHTEAWDGCDYGIRYTVDHSDVA